MDGSVEDAAVGCGSSLLPPIGPGARRSKASRGAKSVPLKLSVEESAVASLLRIGSADLRTGSADDIADWRTSTWPAELFTPPGIRRRASKVEAEPLPSAPEEVAGDSESTDSDGPSAVDVPGDDPDAVDIQEARPSHTRDGFLQSCGGDDFHVDSEAKSSSGLLLLPPARQTGASSARLSEASHPALASPATQRKTRLGALDQQRGALGKVQINGSSLQTPHQSPAATPRAGPAEQNEPTEWPLPSPNGPLVRTYLVAVGNGGAASVGALRPPTSGVTPRSWMRLPPFALDAPDSFLPSTTLGGRGGSGREAAVARLPTLQIRPLLNEPEDEQFLHAILARARARSNEPRERHDYEREWQERHARGAASAPAHLRLSPAPDGEALRTQPAGSPRGGTSLASPAETARLRVGEPSLPSAGKGKLRRPLLVRTAHEHRPSGAAASAPGTIQV